MGCLIQIIILLICVGGGLTFGMPGAVFGFVLWVLIIAKLNSH